MVFGDGTEKTFIIMVFLLLCWNAVRHLEFAQQKHLQIFYKQRNFDYIISIFAISIATTDGTAPNDNDNQAVSHRDQLVKDW